MTSRGKIGHMDAPAATAEQSGLHHVVAHDMAAHGFLAAKFWQTAAFGEGPHPQYGVVTPESCFGSRPPDEARTRDCAISRGCELLPPGESCSAVDDRGNGLNQAYSGGPIHDRRHLSLDAEIGSASWRERV